MDEIKAKQIIFANTKRKKRKEDLLTIARAFDWLVKNRRSREKVGREFGLSTEMIRQFLTVLNLPAEVQRLFGERALDSVDVAKEIAALPDPDEQVELARKIADMGTKDARDIKRLVKRGQAKVGDAKRAVLDAKGRGMHVILVDFDDETLYNTGIEVDAYGTYVLQWEIGNTDCNSTDQVTLSFAEQADAGPTQNICTGLSATLEGNEPTAGTGTWTVDNAPSGGTVTFAGNNVNQHDVNIDVSEWGTYILQKDLILYSL